MDAVSPDKPGGGRHGGLPGVWAGEGDGAPMAWVRAPIYFPSMVMEMMPLSRAAQAALNRGRLPREVQFRVPPRANKVRGGAAPGAAALPRPGGAAPRVLTAPGRQVEIKKYLEQVYDLRVRKVNTANYDGKVKRSKGGLYKRPDWKKAYVMLEVSTSGTAGA